jgi:hypothetical protein
LHETIGRLIHRFVLVPGHADVSTERVVERHELSPPKRDVRDPPARCFLERE